MRPFKTTSLVSVVPVDDFAAALEWYEGIFGPPDEIPMECVARWCIVPDAWLQIVDKRLGSADKTEVLFCVEDVVAVHDALQQAGIAVGHIADYGAVYVCAIRDPDGNSLSFAQAAPPPAPDHPAST